MPPERSEDTQLDRELEELLQELRVALPGVQILFAFLLVVPFNGRFERVTELQRGFYFAALCCTLASVTLLIAPSAYHRVRFRDYDKEQLIRTSTRLSLAGLALLALALGASMFFVTDFVFDLTLAAVFAGLGLCGLAGFWFGLPLSRKLRDQRSGRRA